LALRAPGALRVHPFRVREHDRRFPAEALQPPACGSQQSAAALLERDPI
jgi:hypothetical protein